MEFDLLEKQSTDPPNVRSLGDAIEFMEEEIAQNRLTVNAIRTKHKLAL